MEDTKLNERYRLLTRVGSGGMATVYKGVDVLLERRVAVKVLRQRFAEDPEFLERFQREARAAAKLDHPNIVTVFDVGRDGGDHYIVMEFVDGQDLKTLIRREGRLSVAETLDIATQIARGVGHAHKAGIIHRDIKPQNVLITHDGCAKVVDFGIARALSQSGLTDSDTVWGSPVYFAPEQAAGDSPTPASDVYSIGVVMYEMLAGTPPFHADNPTALAMKHLRDEPPPLSVRNPLVPSRLEWIVRKLLSKEPAARYRSAEQLVHVLEDYRLQVEQPTGLQQAATMTDRYVAPEEKPAKSDSVAVRTDGPLGGEAMTWVLSIVALIAVVGLIPLWWLVYRSYASLPTIPSGSTATPLIAETEEAVTVTVPRVLDRPVDEARRLLERSGLELAIAEEREAAGVDEGIVIEQDPSSGESVPDGSKVSVVVSGPGREVTMPDMVGFQVGEMKEGLESMRLEVVVREAWSAEPEGLVTAQQPETGATVRAGETVTLTVSSGSTVVVDANLGQIVVLRDGELQQRSFQPGQVFGVTLRWEALRTIGERYVVFLHLIGPDGDLVTQDDRQPHVPTSDWNPGTVMVDPHQLRIPEGAGAGRYQLRTGMYPAGQPGNRLAVVDPGQAEEQEDSLLIAEIEVE